MTDWVNAYGVAFREDGKRDIKVLVQVPSDHDTASYVPLSYDELHAALLAAADSVFHEMRMELEKRP